MSVAEYINTGNIRVIHGTGRGLVSLGKMMKKSIEVSSLIGTRVLSFSFQNKMAIDQMIRFLL